MALAGELERRFPEDAFVKFTYAPHSVTTKALEIVRSEYSAITEHEWKLLRRLHIHKAITHGLTS
jgi:hypothetical protein